MWRAAWRGAYVALWRLWFRHGRGVLSRAVDRVRPRQVGTWPSFTSLDDFGRWWATHTRWKSDPLWGLVDIVASPDHARWQWQHKGIFEDDCDGLAYMAAQHVRSLADPGHCYVVTLLLDPFEFPNVVQGIALGAHVLCIFRHEGEWRVLSNSELYPQSWPTFERALEENPFTRGHRVLWYELRDADMRYLVDRKLPTAQSA